jgi:hypothetical protein
MLSVLFVLFFKALDNDDIAMAMIISFCLVVFEANNGFILFSSIVYAYIIHRFIIPKILQNFNCIACDKIAYVLFSYIGYYLFLQLASTIFMINAPYISYYIIYYIVIEFFLVSLI